jgi:hypothetical protein
MSPKSPRGVGHPARLAVAPGAEILEAVAAERPATVSLPAEPVAAPTLLAAGQSVMRRAFERLGLEPSPVPGARRGRPAHAGEAAEGANAIEASCAIIAAPRGLGVTPA